MIALSDNTEALTFDSVRSGQKTAFVASTLALIIVYAASSAPIPLYTSYSQMAGLTNSDLAMTAVAYFTGTVIALLMFARLSNYLGRKPLSFITLVLAAMGCLAFLRVTGASTIFTGRLMQGISCGLASSAIAAYAVDAALCLPAWLGTAVISGAPMAGLALGAFGSGALKEYGSGSLTLVFWILLGMLVVCAVLFICSRETVTRKKGALMSMLPQIQIPRSVLRFLPAAACTFVGTWAIGGLYQAFSATMATELLGSSNALIAAAVFASLMAPNLLGSMLGSKLRSRSAQQLGMSLFMLCIMMVAISLRCAAVGFFFIASVCAGIAWGMAFSGAMRSLLIGITQEDCAGVLSAIFLISYSGAAAPNLVVGRLASIFKLPALTLGYASLVALTCVLTFIFCRFASSK